MAEKKDLETKSEDKTTKEKVSKSSEKTVEAKSVVSQDSSSKTSSSNKTKEISVQEKKVPAKKQKKVKVVSAKKLPGLFKKKYTEKSFEKKVLKKIYIETDKKLVEKQFTKITDKKGREILVVDKKSTLPKEEFNRCKIIAKDVKNQKVGIKFVPLIAAVCLICAIGITVTIFKNIVVEKAITSAMQGIFGAKTDIAKVDLQIFGASLEIDGLEQANADSPMKNIFQIDKIDVSFNLTDLLRGKFHAKNIEVSGVALDTDRKTSGELIKDSKTKSEKTVIKKVQEESTSLADAASAKLKEMFENYNPETMLENVQNELKSPEVAKTISSDVQAKVEKWKNVPSEYETSIKNLSSSVNEIVKTDWGKIYDVSKLTKMLENVNTAITESESLQKKMKSTATDIKTDTSAVTEYSNELTAAIKSDTDLVDSKISEMKKLFSVDGLKNIMSDAITSILYEKAGKFYPYIDKAMNAALSAKGSSNSDSESTENSETKEKKAKKQKVTHDRLAGRTIYYKNDTVPKLLIENVKASGYEYQTNNLLFEGTATEISSDQNMRGKPAKINADFKVLGKANNANVTIDARDSSSAPLVLAKYNGKGYPINADAQVFALKSNSDINATLTADKNGTFVVGGTLDMALSEMTGMDFTPEKVCTIYKNALSGIKKLTVGFDAGYDATNGLVLKITNMDKLALQIVTPVTNALTGELNTIANDAKTKVTTLLSEKTGIASEQINQFMDIKDLVSNQQNQVESLKNQLESKKKEINKQIQNAGKNAAQDATKKLLKNLF